MPSVHGFPEASFISGTGCNTTTAQYKAVYLSADNTVSICNTVTNFSAFVGITQNYVGTVGDAITVKVAGPTKAVLKGASITAGNLVSIAAGTSTALGHVAPHSIVMGATPTAGSAYLIGQCLVGSASGTNTVCEIMLNPMISNALTTTVVA